MNEQVRIFRLIEYTGPRDQVERQIANSVHGERRVRDIRIRAVTIGEFADLLEKEGQVGDPNKAPWDPDPDTVESIDNESDRE